MEKQLQDTKAALHSKPLNEKFTFELTRPVGETIAKEEFIKFVTIGAATDVPKFSNRAKAFDWWTKTLWYDCKSVLDTIHARALKQKALAEDCLVAKDVIEDSIEFLNLFGTGWENNLNPMPTTTSQFHETLQALMEALNYVRLLGLRAEIDATPIVYPPTSNTVEEKTSKNIPSNTSSWGFEEWERYWDTKYGLYEEDWDFDVGVRRRKRKPKPSLGESQVLPPEISPGIEAKNCPVHKGSFGLPRTIAESLATSNLEALPEFKTAFSYEDKVTALDNCLTRILEMCHTDQKEAWRVLKHRIKRTGLKKRLLKDLDEILLLVFSFCARNDLCDIPRIGSQWSTYSWFTRFLPKIIEGLDFLRIQFDREFLSVDRQKKAPQLLLTYSGSKQGSP